MHKSRTLYTVPPAPYVTGSFFTRKFKIVSALSAFSMLQHGVSRELRPIAWNFPRLKIRAICTVADFSTEPRTITSYSWEYSLV